MNAAREFARTAAECQKAIERLQAALAAHAAQQAGHPDFWTYDADLRHVRVELLQLAAFLGDREAREILHAEGADR